MLFCAVSSFCELILTDIKKNENSYAITFNNTIQVSGVSLSNGEIKFPEYAANGKIYRNFSVLNRDFSKKLYESVKLNKISQNSSQITYKINKFKLTSSSKTVKAFASVIFEDKLEVECRVMEGKHGLWVAWPSKKESDTWKKNFIIINKNLKNSIETELIKRYTTQYGRI